MDQLALELHLAKIHIFKRWLCLERSLFFFFNFWDLNLNSPFQDLSCMSTCVYIMFQVQLDAEIITKTLHHGLSFDFSWSQFSGKPYHASYLSRNDLLWYFGLKNSHGRCVWLSNWPPDWDCIRRLLFLLRSPSYERQRVELPWWQQCPLIITKLCF